MFTEKYLEWNKKRIKTIIDFYGSKYIYLKKVLDLGCGHGDVGGSFKRLGADVTYVDARDEHLKLAQKKFPGTKTIKHNIEDKFIFSQKKYDIVLSLDLINYIKDYEQHIRDICSISTNVVIECSVLDTDQLNCEYVQNNSKVYDAGVGDIGSVPSAALIEKILLECGMEFRRIDDQKLNSTDYIYDWQVSDTCSINFKNRRLWFAKKANSIVKFAPIKEKEPEQQVQLPPTTSPTPIIKQFLNKNVESINNTNIISTTLKNNKFVIVIPSYNNEKYCVRNIESALNQNYPNFRVIFTDDCSIDNTFNAVSNHVANHRNKDKCTLIKNTNRIGALENLYNMIHSCEDDEIILTLDGDDWFPHENVLNKLNYYYSNEDIWMTYGQYTNYPMGGKGISAKYPDHIVKSNNFRKHAWCASHLRTFYAWLFKKINKQDLMYENKFLQMTWDLGMMYPMLEMAGDRSRFIEDILYVYNLENPINDHKVNRKLQYNLDIYLRGRPKYSKIDKPEVKSNTYNVGLLLIATNKYDRYIQGIINSADRYFLNKHNVTYYIFTDTNKKISSSKPINIINIEHKPFPFASMDRFQHFSNNKELLSKEDYLFYVDVDCLFVDFVDDEIFGNLVGAEHCGFIGKNGPVEKDKKSCLYVDKNYSKKYDKYFGGGFSGGKASEYLKLSEQCEEWKNIDLNNGIMPLWHDETLLNRYFLDNRPEVILSPSYHYPQSNMSYYKRLWKREYKPKILLLDKNHGEVRK